MATKVHTLIIITLITFIALTLPCPAEGFQDFDSIDEIIFANRKLVNDPHWYANLGYFAKDDKDKAYSIGGQLCKLNTKTKELTILLDDPQGTVRDPQVHYDANKILFSYRKGGTGEFHLYEINTDGTNLTQITTGDYSDIEPSYLPDGGIVFCSTRCKRWVNCWKTQVAVIYRCDADGSNVRPLSSNNEQDNTPWPLPDGRILYQRWEYVDRSQVHYHHLWTMNPDGTSQMVYYGNMHPGIVMIDAKPIAGTDKIVANFSPGHGIREHQGSITIVSPKNGPDDQSSARMLKPEPWYRDPYPISESCILVAINQEIQLMDQAGQIQGVFRLPENLIQQGYHAHEPRPLIKRQRERIIPSRVDLDQPTGELILTDIYTGRNMEGIQKGAIKKLLVLETLPIPVHFSGGYEPVTEGGSFTLERILGTVPVEPDGSAYFKLPAERSFFFVALDENNNSVKRMHSFLTVMPGETTSCVGCHEQRTQTPANVGKTAVQALAHAPAQITPLKDIPEVYDFPRDIQPILDKHCIKCHNTMERKAGVLLTGDRGPMYTHSYLTLTHRGQFADNRNQPRSNFKPYSLGAPNSPLIKKALEHHHGVTMSQHEIDILKYWIEAGATFPGTYAAIGWGVFGDAYGNDVIPLGNDWPETHAALDALTRRCLSCHKENKIPFHLAYARFARHNTINLTHPEQSIMLLAPLAKEAGGFSRCMIKGKDGQPDQPIFKDKNDPDYQKVLALYKRGHNYIQGKQFHQPNYRPSPWYIREMQRYGVLPKDLPENTPIDPYATDRTYWQSLWFKPENPKLANQK